MLLFDLVFKSGEFYGDEGSFWDDLTVELLGAALGAAVTVGLFVWALWDGKKKELKMKNDLERERLLYLDSLVKNSITAAKAYLKGMKMFVNEVEPQTIEMPPFNIPITNDFKRVVFDIDRERHFHAYRNQIKDDNIFLIFSTIDYFETIRNDIIELMSSSIKIYQEVEVESVKEMNNLLGLLFSYNRSVNVQEIPPKEKKLIEETFLNYKRYAPDRRLIIDKVINPLDLYYRSPEPRTEQFEEIGLTSSRVYQLSTSLVSLNQRCKHKIEEYLGDMQEELSSLKKGYEPLGKYCKLYLTNSDSEN